MLAIELKNVEIGHVISADYKERSIVEVLFSIFDRPCCSEFDLFGNIGDCRTIKRSVTKCFLNFITEISDGDDNVGKSKIGKVCNQMGNRRTVYYWDTRLWPLKCQRAKTRSLAAAHNAGFHITL